MELFLEKMLGDLKKWFSEWLREMLSLLLKIIILMMKVKKLAYLVSLFFKR